MGRIDEIIAGKAGDAVALIGPDGSRHTYDALCEAVASVGSHLVGCGVGPGDRVLLVAENGVEFPAASLGVVRCGAWLCPVNARMAAPELKAIIAHADPRAVLFASASSAAAAVHAEAFGAVPGPVALGASLPMLLRPEASAANGPEGVAALFYTSGSTGQPKGVMLGHESLIFNAGVACEMRAMSSDDEYLAVLPGTHIMAFATGILATLRAGGRLRTMPRFETGSVLQAFTEGVTIFSGVPQMYEQLLRAQDQGARIVAPALRMIGAGGAPLDPGWKARVEEAFGLVLQNGYGLTEAGPGISSTSLGPARRDGSVGYAYPDCVLRLADQGVDGVGELCLRGPQVMAGYFRDPEATATAIDAEGFLHTGDLALIDPDGAIHIVGRLKELIIRSGFNVYPPEVEAALTALPGVHQAAVVGRAVPGNEEVLAFVTGAPGIDGESLRAALRGMLAPYKLPAEVIVLAEMPQTPAGKIAKRALLQTFADGGTLGDGPP